MCTGLMSRMGLLVPTQPICSKINPHIYANPRFPYWNRLLSVPVGQGIGTLRTLQNIVNYI